MRSLNLTTNVDVLGPWAWAQMGLAEWVGSGKSALGEVAGGEVKWAVIYDHYNKRSVQMHIAINDVKFVTRRAISAAFEYPFEQLKVNKILGMVNSENVTALEFDMRLGFKLEAIIEDVYENGDLYVLSMTRNQCRWLRGK